MSRPVLIQMTMQECLSVVGAELVRVESESFAYWQRLTGCSPRAFRRAWLSTGLNEMYLKSTKMTTDGLHGHVRTVKPVDLLIGWN